MNILSRRSIWRACSDDSTGRSDERLLSKRRSVFVVDQQTEENRPRSAHHREFSLTWRRKKRMSQCRTTRTSKESFHYQRMRCDIDAISSYVCHIKTYVPNEALSGFRCQAKDPSRKNGRKACLLSLNIDQLIVLAQASRWSVRSSSKPRQDVLQRDAK